MRKNHDTAPFVPAADDQSRDHARDGDLSSGSLEALLDGPMDVASFLPLAGSITKAVRTLHDSGVLHRDLRPGNIQFDSAGQGIVLTGLDHVADVTRGREPSPRIDVDGASLPYMAPEQTGRMNRSIDARSDLYSLGVVFYQMLTGALPFTANEPLDWLYAHIARRPERPSRRVAAIPDVLSSLVLRLLAKNADERYQTAAGLEADLRRCSESLQESGSMAAFPLGAEDFPARWIGPGKLYSRQRERKRLAAALDRVVSTGVSEIALVEGPAGVGKSALVREMTKEAIAREALFVAGKADQARRDVPFATLGVAFGYLVRTILRHPEEKVAQWSKAIEAAMGRNGRLLVDIIPELRWLVGDQPKVPQLGPAEASNRFHALFRRFLGAVATAEHPLILVVDDLQWIDRASLALLEDLTVRPELRYVCLIGAYRTEGSATTPSLRRAIEEIRRSRISVTMITVEPLSSGDVLEMVADATRSKGSDVVLLAELIHHKTGGNPFFLHQFLASIAEDGMLVFDRDVGSWVADTDAVAALGITDNVVELMVDKLLRLPPPTLETVKRLACLGHKTRLGTLAQVVRSSEAALVESLLEAQSAGLLTLRDDAVRFTHDRIQEAAYSLIPRNDRADWHLEIGRRLLAGIADDALDEWIFAVVDHLDRGVERMESADETNRLCELHVLAGNRARGAVAYGAARLHYARAQELLNDDAWRARYRDTLDLHLALLESEFVAGDFNRATELFAQLRDRVASTLDRAEVLRRWMLLHQGVGRIDEALAYGLESLAILGETFPSSPQEIYAAYLKEHQDLHQRLADRQVDDLELLPVATDPTAKAVMSILAAVGACAYNAQQALAPLVYCRALAIALDQGCTSATCMSYISYGAALVSQGDVEGATAFADLALRLNDRFADIERRGMLLYVQGAHVNLFRRHMRTSLPLHEAGFRACQDVGDIVFANYHASAIVTISIESGMPLSDVLQVTAEQAAYARETRNVAVLQWILAARQLARCLRGTTERGSLDDAGFSEAKSFEIMGRARFYTGVANLHVTRMEALVFGHRWAEAMTEADRCAKTVNALRSGPREVTYHFCRALALAGRYSEVDTADQVSVAQKLDEAARRLAFWARNCPDGYSHRYDLACAELARVQGRDLDAMRLYDEAIASAGRHGFTQYEGLAGELAARFYRRRGLDRIARLYRSGARSAYERWGAVALVARMDAEEDPSTAPDESPAEASGTRLDDLDLVSVLEASQAVSNEIELDRLVEKLLRLALEDAGADRGLLLMVGDEPLVVAEATAGSDAGVQVDQAHREPAANELPRAVLRYVQRTREMVLVDDAGDKHSFSDDDYFRSRPCPRSVLCLPLLKQAQLVGILYIENRLTPGAFTPDRTALIEVLASQAAISLENARLYEEVRRERAAIRELNATLEQRVVERTADLDRSLAEQQQILEELGQRTRDLEQARDLLARLAFVDGLTGIANRRGFDDALELEWRRALRSESWLSVILVDLDWFKAINDRFGHARGDDCLQAVAQSMSLVMDRSEGLVARYGGEELVVLLPEAKPAAAVAMMQRLLGEVRAIEFENPDSPHGILTASAGGVSLRPAETGGEPAAAMAHADRALYAAKAAGRDCAEHLDLGTSSTTRFTGGRTP